MAACSDEASYPYLAAPFYEIAILIYAAVATDGSQQTHAFSAVSFSVVDGVDGERRDVPSQMLWKFFA
jgi:hypothetical protein